MRRLADRYGPPLGAIGSLVIAGACVITALGYSGSAGEAYSPLNHWVSELGEVDVSQLALLFNVALIVGGICYALFMIALGVLRRTPLAWLYTPVGVIAGVAGALVGVFPMNSREMHSLAALTFFNVGWVSVGLASLDFVRHREARFPLWLVVMGAVTVTAFIAFLASVASILSDETFAAPEARPDIWIVPVLEWAVVGGILLWTVATSVTWWRANRDAGS